MAIRNHGHGGSDKDTGQHAGYLHAEFGPLNQIVHLWDYATLEERRERRERLFANDEWKAYIQEMHPLLLSQRNKFLIPTPCSPMGNWIKREK